MESEASDLDTRSVSHQIGAARFPVHRDLAGFDFEVSPVECKLVTQLEQGKFAHPVHHLKSNPQRPDVLELERSHLADDLALVPRLAMSRNRNGAHDGLPSS